MKILKKQKINFHMQNKVEKIQKTKSGAIIHTKDQNGNQNQFECDIVLISVGRKPNTNGLNLEKIGIDLDDKFEIYIRLVTPCCSKQAMFGRACSGRKVRVARRRPSS